MKANLFASKLLGYELNELINTNLYNYFTQHSIHLSRRNIKQFATDGITNWDASVISKKGEEINIQIKISRLQSDEDIFLLLTMYDITSEKKNSFEQKRYRRFVELIEILGQIGFWQYDLSTREFWASSGTKTLFGLDRIMTLDDFRDMRLDEYCSEIQKMVNGLIIVDELHDVEFDILRQSDEALITVHSVAEYDYFKNVIYGYIQNISDFRTKENELVNAKERTEELYTSGKMYLAKLSNEINTPLNSIVGFAQLMTHSDLPAETRKEYGDYINNSCKNLLHVVGDLLDISKIDNGQFKVQIKSFKMNDFLNEIVISYAQISDKKGIEIKLNLKEEDKKLEIFSDESKLNKVISNLIDNAIRFTSRGYIELGCSQKESDLFFYVKDTGIGISETDFETIFERFSKRGERRNQYSDGPGYGLAICKSLVNLLGGSIWVESKTGEGSTFYFTIPVVTEDSSSMNADKFTESGDKIDKAKTCLIVDEHEYSFTFLEEMLSSAGFRVLWAKDSDEAIFMSLNEHVDIVLMDLKMSQNNGSETARIIKSKRPELPVIMQTSSVQMLDNTKAILAGCDDLIARPFDKKDFLKKVGSPRSPACQQAGESEA